ncbi:MAG: carboxypeptidase regulatory-like domain-containing protein, partial [Anaerolineales bacterium]
MTSTPVLPTGPTPTPKPSAAITFKVALPTPLLAGEVLYLSVVDEVTGLGLNPVNYAMQGMDTLDYTVTIPFAIKRVVKYRYMRQGKLPTLEDTSADKAVRYRMYFVSGSGEVDDVVSAWSDSVFNSPNGRITGQVVDSSKNSPIPNILIAAGGHQTLTDSNGKFNLEALPVGTHNLVAYAMDGTYQTFQQGARVEVGKSTQVTISLTPASMVTVVFTVSVPGSVFQNLPIRMAGNLYQLGDTFGDLQGGLSTLAARMPLLSPLPDGRYTISLSLPVGADVRYKYTLGDGFWNAEHGSDGSFVVRQLIVPASQSPLQEQDAVTTWQAGTASPILFEVNAPANTPVGDIVSIQFNPYGWTEPIPMWPRGKDQWVYQLYSPLNMLGDFEYRYCRNDQCGLADDVKTALGQSGRPVSTTLAPQDLQDTITGWNWFQPGGPAAQVGLPVTQRQTGFWAGVEFLPSPDPTWQVWTPLAIQDVKSRYANWLVLTPTWSVSRTNPFVFSPVPGVDALWVDNLDTINHARASNLNTALFPMMNLPSDEATWWQSAPRDAAWWDTWFDRYAAFAAYHADLATKAGAQALILGGDWVTPALPGGQINGSSSGVPVDAEVRWDTILADVRKRFNGQVLWAVSYPGGLQSLPAFASSLDGVYLLWNAPLTGSSADDLKASAGQLLDNDIQPFQVVLGKPVILAAAYPAVNDAASESLPTQALFQPGTAQVTVNLQAQEDVYQALMMAVNERAWLGGFVSRGYYPPVALQDASASVHG